MTREEAEKKFEEALIECSKAVDGMGRAIFLYRGPYNAEALRTALRDFMARAIRPGAVFIADMARAGEPDDQLRGEAAYWRNLALLANAAAAAVDYERAGCDPR